MSDIEAEIRKLVSSYGYQYVNDTLQLMMRNEYIYLSKLFQTTVTPVSVSPIPAIDVSQPTIAGKKQKKVKKVKVVSQPKVEELTNSLVLEEEIKEVVVTKPTPTYRDPKEIKEFQKVEEEKKRKENEEAGIELSQILTKENLKQWIEVEGHTYAWVAREKAGCKESQIAATAQMMGIKSRITKKKALIMAGR
jgi:CRISPR/Cas system CSM-associated protein Csm4 (group 5 of RAMP superfamily)